jgi:hypothetical protein
MNSEQELYTDHAWETARFSAFNSSKASPALPKGSSLDTKKPCVRSSSLRFRKTPAPPRPGAFANPFADYSLTSSFLACEGTCEPSSQRFASSALRHSSPATEANAKLLTSQQDVARRGLVRDGLAEWMELLCAERYEGRFPSECCHVRANRLRHLRLPSNEPRLLPSMDRSRYP